MYLLKIKRKEDETRVMTIEMIHEYKEFNDINDIIKFLFSQSLYIKSYEIFKMEVFKDNSSSKDKISIVSTQNPERVHLSSGSMSMDLR